MVLRGQDDVAGRVDVQRHGFERSTFDVDSWQRMAAGPGFRPELDLVLRRRDGLAVVPGPNTVAVAAYLSAGFTLMETMAGVTRTRSTPAGTT